MKKLPFILVFFCLLATTSHARDFVIVLSPYQEAIAATAQINQVLSFITSLDGGDHVRVMDGYHLTTLGEFHVPEGAAYKSARARLNANREAVMGLSGFPAQARVPGGSGETNTLQALRLPQLLRHIATSRTGAGALEVVILGSPVYDDPRDAPFSMAGGAIIPSDRHLTVARDHSPFGTKDQDALLHGMRIHLGYPDGTLRFGDQYAFLLERFWTLYVEAQGGVLVSFTGDVTSLLARARQGASVLPHGYELNAADKLEMLILRSVDPRQSIHARAPTSVQLQPAMLQGARKVELGLSWDCTACDLDLYARPYPDADILYFGQTQTPEGRYWKDFRTSPRDVRGFETIEFTVPLDVRALTIVISHYEGEAPAGITGEIRLAVDGQTYAKVFSLTSRYGNKGDGVMAAFAGDVAPIPQVLVINPLFILGIEQE